MDAKTPVPQHAEPELELHQGAARFLNSLPSRTRLHAVTLAYEVYHGTTGQAWVQFDDESLQAHYFDWLASVTLP